MRITDIPMIYEVKEAYIHYRKDGKSREEAVRALMEDYHNELTEGAEDDGLLFWIGLADGQYYRKELSQEVADKATAAINVFLDLGVSLAPGDLHRRIKKYKEAPMSEKKVGKPRPKFRCPWAIGDVYAYPLSGPDAEKEGIAGKYALLRKVDEHEGWDGRSFAVVTVTLWDTLPLPTTAEEFSREPLMVFRKGGRMFTPRDHAEYRAELLVSTLKQLRTAPFEYLGNFSNTPMPNNEIIFSFPGETLMFELRALDYYISLAHRVSNITDS